METHIINFEKSFSQIPNVAVFLQGAELINVKEKGILLNVSEITTKTCKITVKTINCKAKEV